MISRSLPVVLLLSMFVVRADERTATWLGEGHYNNSANWDLGITPVNGSPLPGDTYRVIVGTGTMTLNISPTTTSFDLANVALTVSGTRTITSQTAFGSGVLITGGALGLAGSASLTAGNTDLYLNLAGGLTLSNNGTFTHAVTGSGASAIVLNSDVSASGTLLRNASGATFTASMTGGEGSVGYGGAHADNRFLNEGTFVKTGAFDYAVNVAFRNSGTVNVQQGTLHLNGGDSGATTGTFVAGTGATLALGSDLHFQSGASVTGAGSFLVKSGTVEFASGSMMNVATLQMQSGTLAFRSGSTLGNTALVMNGGTLELDIDHTFANAALGENGTFTGTGHLTLAGTTDLGGGNFVFGGSGLKELSGSTTLTTTTASRYLNVQGGTELRNTGSFTQTRNGSGENVLVLNSDSAGGPSVFRNAAGATFTANMAAGEGGVGYGAASADNRFLNDGTFLKTGAHAYAFNVALTNAGTMIAQQGALHINAGGTATGTFAINADATLGINGMFDFQHGSSVTGDGTLRILGGTTTFLSGSALQASTLRLEAGTAAFRSGSVLGPTSLAIAGGTLEMDIDHTFSGATFTTGGGVTGSGRVTFVGPTGFDENAYVFGGSGVKEFAGTTALSTVAGNQYFNVNGGAEVRNTGSFSQIRNGTGESAIVLNADASGFPSIFRNAAGGTFTATMNAGPGGVATAAAGSGVRFINEGSFVKNGWHDYVVGVEFANSGSVNLQQGALVLAGGDGGGTTGTFTLQNGTTLRVSGGFSFGTGASITGNGAFESTGGATTFLSGSTFTASTLKVIGGTTAFRSGSTLGTTTLLLAGGTLESDIDHTFSTATFAGGGTVSGMGHLVFHNPDIDQSSYAFQGTGLKEFTGTIALTSGAAGQFFNIAGETEVKNSGTFTQTRSGAGASALVLNADGVGGATFRNASSFIADMTGGEGRIATGAPEAPAQFLNEGTFLKQGVHNYEVDVAFTNSGTVTVQEGAFVLNAGDGDGTSGDFEIGSSATLVVAGGFDFQTGSTVSGAGTFSSKNGYTTFFAGSSMNAATLNVAGGTVAFRAGSMLGAATALTLQSGTLEMDVNHTFTGATFGTGTFVSGTGNVTFAGTTAFQSATVTFSGSGLKQFSGTTTFAPGGTDSYLNITGGTELRNTGAFTQTKSGAGESVIVLASDGAGTSVFRNTGTFTANIPSGIASMGYAVLNPGTAFINTNSFVKTGGGLYQINVPIDNSGTILVSQGTLSITAGVSNPSGTILIDNGAVLDLSENIHASTTGTLTHSGANLALGTNSLTVAVDYQNPNFGVGNAFNGRANVTGAGSLLATDNTALAFTGNAAGGAIDFGLVHVGDAVSATYGVKNTGSGAAVRGAFQTAAGGARIDDPRLSGTGTTAANFGKLDPGANSAERTITFTATTAGPLVGQQIHVATNFDNVTLPNLPITGAANYYASPVWTVVSGPATLTKTDATHYTLAFTPVSRDGGLLTAELDLLNELLDAIYQDALGGSFDLDGVTHFDLSGFAAFSGIASGSAQSGFVVTFDPSLFAGGTYADVLHFKPTSTNAAGQWTLGTVELRLEASVIPEPSVIALLLAALGAATLTRRRLRPAPEERR